jgi:hypothetical protein
MVKGAMHVFDRGDTVNATVKATRQTQDMALAWAEVQKIMWEHWMRGVESRIQPPQPEAWDRASREIIDAWESSVKLALRAQLDWTGFWTLRLSDDKRSPKEVVEWSRQTYELMKAWNDTQLEMWGGWFTGLRKFGPLEYTSAFVDVSSSWREAVRKSFDASGEWLRARSEQAQRVGPSGNGADVAAKRRSEKAEPPAAPSKATPTVAPGS